MNQGIEFAELLAYTEEENGRWKQFFARHPEALDLPLDIAGDVRKLVLHIFAVELHYAHAVLGLEKIDLGKLPASTLEELFATGDEAARLYREFFAKAKSEEWNETVQLGRINVKASKRKLIAQAFTHSMRHWAQISTFLRQQGLKQDWNHDFLLTTAMK